MILGRVKEMTLNIEMTTKTPMIDFDASQGVMRIWGRSLPENAADFYGPIIRAIDEYKSQPQPTTKLDISLEYFNTSTSRILLDIIRSFEWLKKAEKSDLKVVWSYEKDDWEMEDAGKEYQSILSDIDFELKEVEQFQYRKS